MLRKLILLCLLLPTLAIAEEVRIAVGMKQTEVIALIQKHGGVDITSGLEIIGSKGVSTPKGIFWEFKDYDAVVSLSETGGRLSGLGYWSEKDFGESKSRRAETRRTINVLKLDVDTKKISIEVSHPK